MRRDKTRLITGLGITSAPLGAEVMRRSPGVQVPSNFVHVVVQCPACQSSHRIAFEFEFGALAGEDYVLGEQLKFDEEYSFYRHTIGSPEACQTLDVAGVCETTDVPVLASLRCEHGTLQSIDIHPSP